LTFYFTVFGFIDLHCIQMRSSKYSSSTNADVDYYDIRIENSQDLDENESAATNYLLNKNDVRRRSSYQRQSSLQRNQQREQLYTQSLLNAVINDRRSRLQQNISITLLLLVNTLERFAFYGLICNYILFLNKQPLFWKSYNASLMLLIFFGITHISSLVGGWISDSLLGKFKTITISYIIYIAGFVVFPLVAFNKNNVPSYCGASNSSSSDVATNTYLILKSSIIVLDN
jgi:hypothetical protein